MNDCIFCKIIAGEIPSEKIYEDEYVYAFKDINPAAPFHCLIVPKTHISSAADITSDNSGVISKVFETAAKIAKYQKLDNGFRVVTNSGSDACQSVFHIHFHVLAGKKLSASM